MRERKLVSDGSFCDINLYPDGPQTIIEAKKIGKLPCPHYQECKNGFLNTHQCAMLLGHMVASETIKCGSSVMAEICEFRSAHSHLAGGWIYSLDRKEFKMIPDGEQVALLVEQFAHVALADGKIEKITDCSDNQRVQAGSSFKDIVAYATTKEGTIDLRKIGELEGRFGYNGGRGCDVRSGPCNCGAWH